MQSLTIIGKRWFERTNGNTYFSACALIDGKPAGSIDFQYGYGNQYEWEMFRELEKNGLLPEVEHHSNGSTESPWRYCERNGIAYATSVSDVHRKKDL